MTELTPESFAQGIEQMMNEKNLRNELAAKGLKKVQSYTWEKAEKEPLNYTKLVRQVNFYS